MRIAILPARAGSKRLPHKNIKEFHGKPMIGHVIEALLDSELFDVVHVSTDSEETAKVVRELGATAPFLRPPELSTDNAPVLPVVKWVVETLSTQGQVFDTVAMVMPCSPLLSGEDFKSACETFEASDLSLPLLSIARFPSPPEWAFYDKGQGKISADPQKLLLRSQDLRASYYDAGLFSFFTPEHLKQNSQVASTFLKYELPAWKAVDIDNQEDWELALKLMKLKLS